MANQIYAQTSPYANTSLYGNYLDIANFPSMPYAVDDVSMKINKTYAYRPDLLAFDLYGDSAFWWVFALRNPNVLQDPVFDMKPGRVIFLPKKDVVTTLIR